MIEHGKVDLFGDDFAGVLADQPDGAQYVGVVAPQTGRVSNRLFVAQRISKQHLREAAVFAHPFTVEKVEERVMAETHDIALDHQDSTVEQTLKHEARREPLPPAPFSR